MTLSRHRGESSDWEGKIVPIHYTARLTRVWMKDTSLPQLALSIVSSSEKCCPVCSTETTEKTTSGWETKKCSCLTPGAS
jgi:ribosomal protein L37AE/L43A